MLLSPTRHQPFTPQPQRVGNAGLTIAETLRFYRLNAEHAKSEFLKMLSILEQNPILFENQNFRTRLARYLDRILEEKNVTGIEDAEINNAIMLASPKLQTMIIEAMNRRVNGERESTPSIIVHLQTLWKSLISKLSQP